MSDGFTVGAGLAASTLFECPKCNETIDSSAAACRFCGTTVDHQAALQAAAVLSRVNQACSDAKYIRSTALVIPVFFVLRFLPFFGAVGLVGLCGLTVAMPFWALRWWIKFGKLDSRDPEYRASRNTVRAIGLIVSVLLAILVTTAVVLAMTNLYHPAMPR